MQENDTKKIAGLIVITGIILAVTAHANTTTAPTISDFKGEITEALQTTSLQTNLTPNDLKDYLAEKFAQYGGNYYEIYKTIECESEFKYNATGDSGLAFGVAQFHKPTFDRFCEGDYKNPYNQIDCIIKMFKNGLNGHWSCWQKLFN